MIARFYVATDNGKILHVVESPTDVDFHNLFEQFCHEVYVSITPVPSLKKGEKPNKKYWIECQIWYTNIAELTTDQMFVKWLVEKHHCKIHPFDVKEEVACNSSV